MKKKLSAFLCFSFFIIIVQAQVDVYSSGILKLSVSGDIVYINGGFSNAGTATFINNGKFYVLGDLVNNETSMSSGSGILHLSGGATQTVSGSQTFKTYDLKTNNISGIILNNNLSVSGVDTFASGLITTSSTPNYLIYEAGASHTGSADSRHVNGWVKK